MRPDKTARNSHGVGWSHATAAAASVHHRIDMQATVAWRLYSTTHMGGGRGWCSVNAACAPAATFFHGEVGGGGRRAQRWLWAAAACCFCTQRIDLSICGRRNNTSLTATTACVRCPSKRVPTVRIYSCIFGNGRWIIVESSYVADGRRT